MKYTLEEVKVACASLAWDSMIKKDNGAKAAAVLIKDEAVAVTKVASEWDDNEYAPVYIVIQVGDQLYRKDGHYESHYGTEWTGVLYEVKAIERMVTMYERKK